jgi:hypothetical protein
MGTAGHRLLGATGSRVEEEMLVPASPATED